MLQLDEPLKKSFAKVDVGQWATMFRHGFAQFAVSMRRDEPVPDYSGFGLAEILIFRSSPVDGLTQLFEQLPPGASQTRFREGLAKVLDDLRAPPAEETLLIVTNLLRLSGAVRAVEVVPILSGKFKASPDWRNTFETYHASLQFAFNICTHTSTAMLIRALVGSSDDRSRQFTLGQIRIAIRAMATGEPQHLARHVAFFEPEISSATDDIQHGILEALDHLRDSVLDETHWREAEPVLPQWFKDVHRRVRNVESLATPAVVDRLIAQAFDDWAEREDGDDSANDAPSKALQDALYLASQMGHKALLGAAVQIKDRAAQLPRGKDKWVLDSVLAYSGHLQKALNAFAYVARAQELMTRIEARDGPVLYPVSTREGTLLSALEELDRATLH